MLYNLESLASMEEGKILSFSNKNRRQSAMRKEKQVSSCDQKLR